MLLALSLSVLLAHGESSWGRLFETAKKFELSPMEKPAWATLESQPLFTAVWFTDLHITNAETREFNRLAFNTARDSIKPDFALITGDNTSCCTPKFAADKKMRRSHRNQLWLKHFLDEELAVPYHIIPGDNWPRDFEKVFGPTHYSFDYGGYHFQFNATDVTCKSAEGCCTFTPETLAWMAKDFAAASQRPCIFVLHEPLWPPAFLDAGKTADLLNSQPQVIGALAGHLHLDLQFSRGHWRQIIAPSIGRSHRPGFKKLLFYPERVVLEAWEWDAEKKAFHAVPKWERLDVPKQFRPAPSPGALAVENYSSLPPAPKKEEPSLAARSQEINSNLLSFIMSFGLNQFFTP